MHLAKSLKIAIIQDISGSGIREEFARKIHDYKPEIIVLPEYYFVAPHFLTVIDSVQIQNEALLLLEKWSREFDCIIVGGSIVYGQNEYKFNRTYIFNKGEKLGYYDKIHLFRNEGKGQLAPGIEYKVFDTNFIRISVLICADVLSPSSFFNIRGLRPDIIAVPNTSQFRPNEKPEDKFKRDEDIFAAGAKAANAIILKSSAVGQIIGRPLQGRSLIASPGKIEWRIEPENEDKSALIIASIGLLPEKRLLDISVYRL